MNGISIEEAILPLVCDLAADDDCARFVRSARAKTPRRKRRKKWQAPHAELQALSEDPQITTVSMPTKGLGRDFCCAQFKGTALPDGTVSKKAKSHGKHVYFGAGIFTVLNQRECYKLINGR